MNVGASHPAGGLDPLLSGHAHEGVDICAPEAGAARPQLCQSARQPRVRRTAGTRGVGPDQVSAVGVGVCHAVVEFAHRRCAMTWSSS